MFYCPDCGCEFETAEAIFETHLFSDPPFEKSLVCPCCKGKNIYIKTINHCRCCGRKTKDGAEYCSKECEINGKKLWAKDRKRRGLNVKNPINLLVREVELYNKENGTKYSYGQYVAVIRPKIRGRKKK